MLNFESLWIDQIMEMRGKKTAAAVFLPISSLSLERADHMEPAERVGGRGDPFKERSHFQR